MNIESFREYCLSLSGVTEDFPFDSETLVFKVGGKMFALCHVENFNSATLKCDPERATELREQYNAIRPGYHMNKKHWNTVEVSGDVPAKLLFELVAHSYDLIFSSLTKKEREAINGAHLNR